MIDFLRNTAKSILYRAGFEVRRVGELGLAGESEWVTDVIKRVEPYTMTSPHKLAALCHSVEYIWKNKIPGSIVECGVWRGGSMMAAALSLIRVGDVSREIILFDTFEGMPPPTEKDKHRTLGISAAELLSGRDKTDNAWAIAPLELVRRNVISSGYPEENIKFVKGNIEDTIPQHSPTRISLLRLDTDWYESTRHELKYLYPLLSTGGVLIIDDYGCWDGARKAVDEYVEANRLQLLLTRIEPTGRIGVKI
jgi:hypothetical protein